MKRTLADGLDRELHCIYHVTHWNLEVNEATFTFRVDEALKFEFSTAAKARDRTGAQLLRDFMRDFVKQQREASEHEAGFSRQSQTGLDSASAGNHPVSAQEVEREFRVRKTQVSRKKKAKH